ncbi:hypothetical protein ACFOED_08175 [Vulcaniibacterium thermophilum]|uniref:Uncharacterized protein n=1 Tax=Vulcaniibacterium thermophilum TaxID=1169913 RepID=A0A918YZI6_9GAMM|nr:hypothetical protein [Vulcaniibacterium thermophilum]GHE31147.1 hypothetical protein GCM10007167_11340 [Vulcaniibacterium thermophilum]
MTSPTPTESDATPIRPKLTAEEALTRLLELIRTSRTLSDFTPERVSQVMGVELDRSADGYRYYERVAPRWLHGFDYSAKYGRFMFSFDPQPPGTSPDMTDICQLDVDRFSSELEAMGFSKQAYYDSPPQPAYDPDTGTYDDSPRQGRLMKYTFDRMQDGLLEMRIDVYPRGEANDPPEKVLHDCISMIRIF